MNFEPETSICPKCHRQGCSTPETSFDSERMLSVDWICKCGHEVAHEAYAPVKASEDEYTEGEPGSLLADMNELGALIGKPPIRMKKI